MPILTLLEEFCNSLRPLVYIPVSFNVGTMSDLGHHQIQPPTLLTFTKAWHSKPYPLISPSRPELSAVGKNIVVTGGGTGIGKAIATAFAQAGARSVSVIGRRLDRLQAAVQEITVFVKGDTKVLFETGDISKRASIEAAFTSVTQQVGSIDIFVHSAGVLPPFGPVSGYNEGDFKRALDLNVTGVFNSLQAFLPHAKSDATILNVSSLFAPCPPAAHSFLYATTKIAIIKMLDYLGAENPGLHIVSFQPGIVATEMNAENDQEFPDKVKLPGHFAVWLASPEARFLRGKFVYANWDVEELLSRSKEIEGSPMLTLGLIS
ncbi:short chain dehydrogenase domain-containing protein [Sarocladium implicatum]|nr:short chain dehydrogenase domain-containing protein [Sarocladium implicatum]